MITAMTRCRVQAPPPLPWPLRLLVGLVVTVVVAWLLLSTWTHWDQVRSWERTGPTPTAPIEAEHARMR